MVTPAHQFPTGVVLASERRAELLSWAEEVDGLIVEDDYDSELRYDRGPVGALQGLAPERICHVGSASKRLAPGLRLGWVLSPSWLTGELTYAKALSDGGTPALEQLALADFITRGELDRHLRRCGCSTAGRREANRRRAWAPSFPDARLTGVEAEGLFLTVVLEFCTRTEARVLCRRRERAGSRVEGLGSSMGCKRAGSAGIVLGYANHAPRGARARHRGAGRGGRPGVRVCENQLAWTLDLRDRACILTGGVAWNRAGDRARARGRGRVAAPDRRRDAEALERAEQCRGAGGRVEALALDVTDRDAGERLVRSASSGSARSMSCQQRRTSAVRSLE